jgi:hypothetical protein
MKLKIRRYRTVANSDTQVTVLHDSVGMKLLGAAFPDDPAFFKNIVPVSDLEELTQMFINHQNRLTHGFEFY